MELKSITIGAVIASVVIVMIFLGANSLSSDSELVIEPSPAIQESEPTQITKATFLENGSPILGDFNAPITLVEFGDYQCHFCNVFFHSTENKILKNYVETGEVRMIFKDYNIIGPDSVNASHGAHCADEQGMFWKYHDILYSNWAGENNGWASSEHLLEFAQEIGLDVNDWSECMTNTPYSQKILASNNDAKNLGLTGTPAFFVIDSDGKVIQITGAQPYEVFEKMFEEKWKNIDQ